MYMTFWHQHNGLTGEWGANRGCMLVVYIILVSYYIELLTKEYLSREKLYEAFWLVGRMCHVSERSLLT